MASIDKDILWPFCHHAAQALQDAIDAHEFHEGRPATATWTNPVVMQDGSVILVEIRVTPKEPTNVLRLE